MRHVLDPKKCIGRCTGTVNHFLHIRLVGIVVFSRVVVVVSFPTQFVPTAARSESARARQSVVVSNRPRVQFQFNIVLRPGNIARTWFHSLIRLPNICNHSVIDKIIGDFRKREKEKCQCNFLWKYNIQ